MLNYYDVYAVLNTPIKIASEKRFDGSHKRLHYFPLTTHFEISLSQGGIEKVVDTIYTNGKMEIVMDVTDMYNKY